MGRPPYGNPWPAGGRITGALPRPRTKRVRSLPALYIAHLRREALARLIDRQRVRCDRSQTLAAGHQERDGVLFLCRHGFPTLLIIEPGEKLIGCTEFSAAALCRSGSTSFSIRSERSGYDLAAGMSSVGRR